MAKFKVGDKVKRVLESHDPGWFGKVGSIYTVEELRDNGEVESVEELDGHGFPDKAFELVEWTPENGEFIEVSCTSRFSSPIKRKFIGMNNKRAVCEAADKDTYCSWGYYRQIKATKTISIGGKDIEISEESFEAFKKQFMQ